MLTEGLVRRLVPDTDEVAAIDGGSRRARTGVRVRVGDVVFAFFALGTVWWYLTLSRQHFFQWDDWNAAVRPSTLSNLIEPHNGHLSVVPLAIYRGLFAAFGLKTYLPFRVLGVGGLAGLVVALYILTRRRLGAAPALLASMGVFWMPRMALTPFLFNFHLALLCGVICAAALPARSLRSDAVIGATLLVALCTSAVGIAVAAACVTHSMLDGFRIRRWLVTMVPAVAWFGWWTASGDPRSASSSSALVDVSGTVAVGMAKSFAALVVDNRAGGAILIVASVSLLGWRWTRDRPSRRSQLAWMAALVVWWVGLALSRAEAASSHNNTPRYAYVGAVFVLLSLIPAHPVQAFVASGHRLRTLVPAVALTWVLFFANHGGIQMAAVNRGRNSGSVKNVLIEMEAGRSLPDAEHLPRSLGRITAGQYRAVVGRLGPPSRAPGDPDGLLIRNQALKTTVTVAPGRGAVRCDLTDAVLEMGTSVTLYTGSEPVSVLVRRYDRSPTPWRTFRPGVAATITTRGDSVDPTPWRVETSGGCLVDS